MHAQQETQFESRIRQLLILEEWSPDKVLEYGDRLLPVLKDILSALPEDDVDELRISRALFVVAELGGNGSELHSLVQRQLLASAAFVRVNAVKALTALASPADAPLFVAMLNDPDFDVRREAIQALGKVGDDTALLALEIWRTRETEADKTRPTPEKLLRSSIPEYVEEAQAAIKQRISAKNECP